jgi:hypothetical protein
MVFSLRELVHHPGGADRDERRRGAVLAAMEERREDQVAKARMHRRAEARRQPVEGHVGFFSAEDNSHIQLLGGNQSNAVSVVPQRKDNLLAYLWPKDE